MSNQTETLVPETATPFDSADVPDEVFFGVMDEAVRLIESSGIDYLLIGGIASAALGRPRWTHDVDFLVRPEDADRALEVLAEGGFSTQKTNPLWLYKAVRDRVVIDIIFKTKGDVYMDDEMLARAVEREFKGRTLRCAPPEDIVVVKAAVHDEERPRHWHDALGIIIRSDLDWDYLLQRARHASKRVLSLLIYASSNDVPVPAKVIQSLYEATFGEQV